MNVKVFNLISRVNEKNFLVQNDSLSESVCKSKEKWSHNVGVKVKKYMIGVLANMIICRILACVIVNAIKHVFTC